MKCSDCFRFEVIGHCRKGMPDASYDRPECPYFTHAGGTRIDLPPFVQKQIDALAAERDAASEKIRLLVTDCARAETERDALRAEAEALRDAMPCMATMGFWEEWAADEIPPLASAIHVAAARIEAVLARFPRDGEKGEKP